MMYDSLKLERGRHIIAPRFFKPVQLKGNPKLRELILQSGVKGKACKKGLEDMITLDTVREVYARQSNFVYENLALGIFHPHDFHNDMINDLAAAYPRHFIEFFLCGVMEIHGRSDFNLSWLRALLDKRQEAEGATIS